MRIFYFNDSPSVLDFIECLNDVFPLLEHSSLLSSILFSMLLSTCNHRQSLHLSSFWSWLIKQARSNDKRRLEFLKSFAPILHRYVSLIAKLNEDEDPEIVKLVPLLNSPGFSIFTLETLNSVFLNLVCQINLSNLLEEVESLGAILEFHYETFGIIKDEGLKDKMVSFANFLFEKTEFLKKLFYREEAIAKILKRGFREENFLIFLTFLNYFSENVLKNDEVNFNFRQRFFQEVRGYIDALAKRGLGCEFSVRAARFLCVFFEKLVAKQESINCVELFQTLQNKNFPIEFLEEAVRINPTHESIKDLWFSLVRTWCI